MNERIFSSGALLALLWVACPALASDQVVVLGSDPVVQAALAERLPQTLERIGGGLAVDADARTWTTDEGTTLAWDDLLTARPLEGSRALKALRSEYSPALLALAWVSKDKVEVYEAYNLKKRAVTVQVRLVVAETGKVLFQKTLSRASEFSNDEEQGAALSAAFAGWPVAKARAQVAKALEGFEPGSAVGRVKIRVRALNQKEYFQQRGRYLGLALLAGGKGRVWDEFDRDNATMTIRVQRASDFETYYRNLYHAVLVEENFGETFDLDHSKDGATITLTRLPPLSRQLVIYGFTAAQYHDKLAVYKAAVAGSKGTGDVKARFVEATLDREAVLLVSFTYRGDLNAFEEALWAGLQKDGKVPARELVSIDKRSIVYRAGVGAGEPQATVVYVNSLGPRIYREVGQILDGAVDSVEPGNLEKAYDRDRQRLTYRFVSAKSAAEVERALWAKIHVHPKLAAFAQDSSRGRTLAFVYLQPPEPPAPRRFSVVLQNLEPGSYEGPGRSFLAVMNGAEGVSDLKHTYDEADRTLSVDFGFAGDSVYAVDSAIWASARKASGLANLCLGQISEERAVYFLRGAEGVAPADKGRLALLLKNVGPQEQKFVATGMIALLGRVGARRVNSSYVAACRAMLFQFFFDDGDAGTFAVALDKALAGAERFRHVARGISLGNRLEYFYSDHALNQSTVAGSPPAAPAEAGASAPAGGLAGIVDSLDPSVVVVFFRSTESSGHGTGFFVSKSGYLLTNAHVVPGGELSVQTYDGRRYPAQLIKKDADLDLALLKVKNPRRDWPAVQIGDSGGLKRGQPLLVIGTPLSEEYDHSVATGILAGRDRHRGLFQITIPIYSGNSGSPLFDYKGRAVGVVVSVAMAQKRQLVVEGGRVVEKHAREAVENIGFAIPIQFAKPLLSLVE